MRGWRMTTRPVMTAITSRVFPEAVMVTCSTMERIQQASHHDKRYRKRTFPDFQGK
jgi:hypothetical protein